MFNFANRLLRTIRSHFKNINTFFSCFHPCNKVVAFVSPVVHVRVIQRDSHSFILVPLVPNVSSFDGVLNALFFRTKTSWSTPACRMNRKRISAGSTERSIHVMFIDYWPIFMSIWWPLFSSPSLSSAGNAAGPEPKPDVELQRGRVSCQHHANHNLDWINFVILPFLSCNAR